MKDGKKKLASAREVFDVYWKHTRRYPWFFGISIAAGVTLQAAMLAAPLYLRSFFNLLASANPTTQTLALMSSMLVILTFVYFAEWLARRVQTWANSFMQSRIMADLLDSAFGYLMQHSYNFFISRFAGSLTHRTGKYARSFETLYDSIIVSFLPTLLFVLGAIVVLAFRHPTLGLLLAGWVVAFVSFQVYVSMLRQPLRNARAEADTAVTAALADSIGNHTTIAVFAGVTHEQGLFKKVVERWRAATLRSWVADEWIWAGIGLFMIAIEIGLLYSAMIFWGQGLLTIGDFVLIQAYLLTTFDRLVGINRELRRFYDAFADAAEMVAILNMPLEVKDKKNAKKLKVSGAEVWFDDVTFSFNDGTPVLEEFNLRIAGGEKVALVGPSGAGKTTITKLLLRLYDVQRGAIRVDGADISKVTQDSLREAIAFVPQEPILFHRTLMENLRYGRRDATDEEVLEAAKQAHCHEFISKLPLAYETFVGERGIKLSGGERQRVAIARAILKDAPILVLDEATSSLDSESEAYIQDALETLMQDKTVIVIAHRLSTIMKMDRIVVMEGGHIAAQGTHLELINQRGLYQKLWSIQAGGFLGDGHKPKESAEALRQAEEIAELAEDEAAQ